MAFTPPGETRRKVFDFVRERLLSGTPPTIREVQQRFGFASADSARLHLEALVAAGLLAKDAGRTRGYRLPERAGHRPPRLVPLVGRVQAGDLTAAVQEPEGFISITPRAPGDDLFALRVRGESMTGAGILPGDVVIVRRQAEAASGDIVVALVGDEATVKRLRRRGGRVVLQPENPEFAPIIPAPGTLRLLGKVIEVHRYLELVPLVEAYP